MTKTKFEAMDILNKHDIPCGPILSMKEIAEEPSLRETGTIVEVDHPVRGKYLTVGNPIKLSDSPTEVTRSPLLGEHTDEVLAELGYDADRDRDAARRARRSEPGAARPAPTLKTRAALRRASGRARPPYSCRPSFWSHPWFVLTLQEARQILAAGPRACDADTESTVTLPGDLVVLQSLSYKLRVRVEQADGFHYVGTIVECRRDGYVGVIEFDERHIQSRQRVQELEEA